MSTTPADQGAWLARCLGRGDLAPLRPDDVAELAAELGVGFYAGGVCVFRRDEAPAQVHIVREGEIELSRTEAGRRVTFQVLRPGDVFGDIPMLLRMREPFDACAITDSVVLSIDSVALFALLERRPGLARRWLISVAERMAATQQRVGDLLAGSLEASVASLLLREAEGGLVRRSQATVAELLGARRTSVNQVLKRLEADGLVELGYRRIEVRDPDRLAAIQG